MFSGATADLDEKMAILSAYWKDHDDTSPIVLTPEDLILFDITWDALAFWYANNMGMAARIRFKENLLERDLTELIHDEDLQALVKYNPSKGRLRIKKGVGEDELHYVARWFDWGVLMRLSRHPFSLFHFQQQRKKWEGLVKVATTVKGNWKPLTSLLGIIFGVGVVTMQPQPTEPDNPRPPFQCPAPQVKPYGPPTPPPKTS